MFPDRSDTPPPYGTQANGDPSALLTAHCGAVAVDNEKRAWTRKRVSAAARLYYPWSSNAGAWSRLLQIDRSDIRAHPIAASGFPI